MSVEVTRLPSGLTVATDAMPHLHTASLGVWVACGSRHETAEEHGISHFLEHMAFKGTNRRSARQIAEEIEAVGGDLNAATGVEMTAYYARVLRADIPLALDVLADILSEPAFDPNEITREKNVIIQEIGAVEAACGVRPQLPAWLDGLLTKSEHITVMKNDSTEVEKFVRKVSRAAKQGVAG